MKVLKAIVVDDGSQKSLIGGLVEFHLELVPSPSSKVLGGCMILVLPKTKTIWLYGKSVDFGHIKLDDLIDALKNQESLEEFCVTLDRLYENNILIDPMDDWTIKFGPEVGIDTLEWETIKYKIYDDIQ